MLGALSGRVYRSLACTPAPRARAAGETAARETPAGARRGRTLEAVRPGGSGVRIEAARGGATLYGSRDGDGAEYDWGCGRGVCDGAKPERGDCGAGRAGERGGGVDMDA